MGAGVAPTGVGGPPMPRRPPLPFPSFLSQDRFYELANPDRENLCLYGNPDSTWEVDLPAEEVRKGEGEGGGEGGLTTA